MTRNIDEMKSAFGNAVKRCLSDMTLDDIISDEQVGDVIEEYLASLTWHFSLEFHKNGGPEGHTGNAYIFGSTDSFDRDELIFTAPVEISTQLYETVLRGPGPQQVQDIEEQLANINSFIGTLMHERDRCADRLKEISGDQE